MDNKSNDSLETVERRSFLGIIIGIIGAGISAVLGITIGRYATAPAFAKPSEAAWIEVGNIAEIADDKLTRKAITVAQDAGWGQFQAQRLLWINRKGEAVTVYSAVCPHLGCTVNHNEQEFVCACHNSKWSNAGQKVAGPAPRSLDVLEHRVENNILQVKYQDFKQGIATKESV